MLEMVEHNELSRSVLSLLDENIAGALRSGQVGALITSQSFRYRINGSDLIGAIFCCDRRKKLQISWRKFDRRC